MMQFSKSLAEPGIVHGRSSVPIIAAVDAEGMTSMTSLVTPRDISGL